MSILGQTNDHTERSVALMARSLQAKALAYEEGRRVLARAYVERRCRQTRTDPGRLLELLGLTEVETRT